MGLQVYIVRRLRTWTVILRILTELWSVLCCAQSLSHIQLFTTLWTVAPQAPLSMGFSRQEYWSGLPCPSPGDLPNSGNNLVSPASPALQVDSLAKSNLSDYKRNIFPLPHLSADGCRLLSSFSLHSLVELPSCALSLTPDPLSWWWPDFYPSAPGQSSLEPWRPPDVWTPTDLAWAAIREHHGLGAFHGRCWFPCGARGWMLKIKVLAGLVSGGTSLPGLQMVTIYLPVSSHSLSFVHAHSLCIFLFFLKILIHFFGCTRSWFWRLESLVVACGI